MKRKGEKEKKERKKGRKRHKEKGKDRGRKINEEKVVIEGERDSQIYEER
jgi:hypothetical protein